MNPETGRRLSEFFSRNPLSDFLPYQAYDPKSGLFVISDGLGSEELGQVFECLPGAGGYETFQVLESLYAASFLPAGSTLQVTFYASPHIRPFLEAWKGKRSDHPLYRKIVERRGRLYTEVEKDPSGSKGTAPFRDFQLYVSIKIPASFRINHSIKVAQEVSAKIAGLLQSAHLYPRSLSAAGLIALVSELLNPDRAGDGVITWDTGTSLSKQMVDAETCLKIERDQICLRQTAVRSLTVKQYPTVCELGQVGALIGDLMRGADQIPVPFILTLNVIIPEQAKSQAAVRAKASLTTYQSMGFLSKLMPRMQTKKENFDIFLSGLDEGRNLVGAYLHLILYGAPHQDVSRVAQSVSGIFRKQGFVLQEDNFILLPLLLQSLPLGLSVQRDQKLIRRSRSMLSSNAAYLSPVSADWKGTGTPTLLLTSRRGQIMLLDLFDSPGNYNAVVAATSGSGKSFFVNELCLSYLSIGGKVWLIDIGRSYFKLCRFLGGNFIEFKDSAPPCLNPFSKVTQLEGDEGELDLLIPIIGQMASLSRSLTDLERSLIEQAIRQAYLANREKTSITTVIEALQEVTDPRAQDLATMLYPYGKNGRYGRYFEGEMDLDTQNPFTVLELEELAGKPDLRNVVLLLLVYAIQQEMYLAQNRSQRKLTILEEAYQFFEAGTTGSISRFIEHGARRFRKYGGALVTVTQGIHDLVRTDAGQAVLDNSDHLFLLRQKPESFIALKESKALVLDDQLFELLRSLHSIPGKYSEVFVRTPLGSGIGRLTVDPFSYLLYTTKPEEYARVERLMNEEGLSVDEAIERCLGA